LILLNVATGERRRLIESGGYCPAFSADGRILPFSQRETDICLYDCATGKARKILTIEQGISAYIDVSDDGRMILYPQIDEAGSDLMLVENFR
jgi:Tol biopolymer transport system component